MRRVSTYRLDLIMKLPRNPVRSPSLHNHVIQPKLRRGFVYLLPHERQFRRPLVTHRRRQSHLENLLYSGLLTHVQLLPDSRGRYGHQIVSLMRRQSVVAGFDLRINVPRRFHVGVQHDLDVSRQLQQAIRQTADKLQLVIAGTEH